MCTDVKQVTMLNIIILYCTQKQERNSFIEAPVIGKQAESTTLAHCFNNKNGPMRCVEIKIEIPLMSGREQAIQSKNYEAVIQ